MTFRAGFVGLIGQPNAGKSTLQNHLVAEKISIVTPKPQTTRRRVLGIINRPQAQIVLVDAPGVVKAKSGMNAFLEREAQDVIADSDVLCAVINIDEGKKENLDEILAMVQASKKPWFVILTKVDLVDKRHRLTRLRGEMQDKLPDIKVFEYSSQWGKDAAEFTKAFYSECEKLLPESPAPLYDTELYTPHTLRELTAEVIREKCFEELHQELPYQLAVRITKFNEEDPGLTRIFAELVVGREGHKPIIIGKQGSQIKKIGMKARTELEKLLGHQVYLNLDVSVRPEWFENARMMKELGYGRTEK